MKLIPRQKICHVENIRFFETIPSVVEQFNPVYCSKSLWKLFTRKSYGVFCDLFKIIYDCNVPNLFSGMYGKMLLSNRFSLSKLRLFREEKNLQSHITRIHRAKIQQRPRKNSPLQFLPQNRILQPGPRWKFLWRWRLLSKKVYKTTNIFKWLFPWKANIFERFVITFFW